MGNHPASQRKDRLHRAVLGGLGRRQERDERFQSGRDTIIKPNDVVSVRKAETIYVIGAVKKPGAYVLGQYRSLSTLQILALAEGTDKTADTKEAKIMRLLPGSDERSEIPVDLKTILDGKVPDVALKGDDILFVPVSKAKVIGYRTIEAMAQAGTLLRLPRSLSMIRRRAIQSPDVTRF